MRSETIILSVLCFSPLIPLVLKIEKTVVMVSVESKEQMTLKLAGAFVSAVLTYLTAHTMIPVFSPLTEKAGLWGKDLCKKGSKEEDKKMYKL